MTVDGKGLVCEDFAGFTTPPELDWANVPRNRRVEVRDSEDLEWLPARYFGYVTGEECPHIAKVDGHDYYMGWTYCRLVDRIDER